MKTTSKWFNQSLLIGFLIGFFVFIFNWDEKDLGSAKSMKLAVIILGMYFGLKEILKKEKLKNENLHFTYSYIFKKGTYICLAAAIISFILYYLIPNSLYPIITSSKLLKSTDVMISILFFGFLSLSISARVLLDKMSK